MNDHFGRVCYVVAFEIWSHYVFEFSFFHEWLKFRAVLWIIFVCWLRFQIRFHEESDQQSRTTFRNGL